MSARPNRGKRSAREVPPARERLLGWLSEWLGPGAYAVTRRLLRAHERELAERAAREYDRLEYGDPNYDSNGAADLRSAILARAPRRAGAKK